MNRLLKDLPFRVYTTPIEKAGSSGERRLIRGYASVGDVLDRQNEVITLGALVKAREDLLKNHTIFYEHKHSELPIGKTIAVDIDERGLLITVEISKGSHADSVWTLIQEGILNSFSIGGRVLEAEERRDKAGNLFNEITEIELFETSVVGLPANPAAKFELISKSFSMAITEEMRKRGVSYMAKEKNEVKKEVEVEVKKIDVEVKVKEVEKSKEQVTKSEETKTEKSEEVAEDKVEKKEEVKEEAKTEKSEEIEEKVEEKETEKSEEAPEEKEVEKLEKVHANNSTGENDLHWHEAAVDADGNGETVNIITKEGYTGDANHSHDIVDNVVQESDGHPHELLKSIETETEKSEEVEKEEVAEKSEEASKETTPLKEVSSEEKSEEEPAKEEEPIEEKSIDAQLLEKMSEIITLMQTKKEVPKKEEAPVEAEKSEEVETAKSEEKSEEKPAEEVKKEEAPAEERELAVAKSEKTSEKVEEKDLEKVVKIEDAPKEEVKEKEAPTRKGEVIIASTPYASDGEGQQQDEVTMKKLKEKDWCKLIYNK